MSVPHDYPVCRNCAFFEVGYVIDLCARKVREGGIDPVTGATVRKGSVNPATERKGGFFSRKCGRRGRFYKPRIPSWAK